MKRLMLVTLVVTLLLANPAIWIWYQLARPAAYREMPLAFQCMVASVTPFECAAIEYMAQRRDHPTHLVRDVKRYVATVLLMTDEWFNAIFGGYAEETISYRLAVNAEHGGIVGRAACKLIQTVAPNDCTRTRWLESKLTRRTKKGISEQIANLRDPKVNPERRI